MPRYVDPVMTRRVLFVVHQARSDPGRVGLRLRTMGYRTDICRPACGDRLPESMDDHACAVVFGGPMSANDAHEDFIRAELDWIPTVIASGRMVAGCGLTTTAFPVTRLANRPG